MILLDPFADGFVQISLFAVEKSELTVVIELLNGNYYRDFDQNIIDKVISIFSYLSVT